MSADNDNQKPNSDVLKAALEQGLTQEADQTVETKKMLQEKLDEGVQQLRELARTHDLEWPEGDE